MNAHLFVKEKVGEKIYCVWAWVCGTTDEGLPSASLRHVGSNVNKDIANKYAYARYRMFGEETFITESHTLQHYGKVGSVKK